MASAKWSAAEVAALLAAWRDALAAPKYRGFSVRTHMFERFAERCGGATARALQSVCFKRETLRNMSDLICAHAKRRKAATRRSSDATELSWFSLSLAERKAWFAAHNERSYAFLDIDAPTFKEIKALHAMHQRAEDAKRRCYRRVLLRKSADGEWKAVREQGVGSWASAAVSRAAMSTLEASVSDTAAGGDNQSSVESTSVQNAVDGAAVADVITHTQLSGDPTQNGDSAALTDESLPQPNGNHFDEDDGSSTESESDLGAWEEDEDDDDDNETNSSSHDALSQSQQDGGNSTETADDSVSLKIEAVESESRESATASTPVPTRAVVRAESISSHSAEDSDEAPDQRLEEKQPSPAVTKNVDVIQPERTVVISRVVEPNGAEKAVHNRPAEILSSATMTDASPMQPPTSDVNAKQQALIQELLTTVKNTETQVQRLKEMLTQVESERKIDHDARRRDATKMNGLEIGVQDLMKQMKEVQAEQLKAESDRKADHDIRTEDVTKISSLEAAVQGLATQMKEVQAEQTRYDCETDNAEILRNIALTDQRHLLAAEVADIQEKLTSQIDKQRREMEKIRRESAKLQKEANERDQELASLRQDLAEMRSWMKKAAESSEATPKAVPIQDQAAVAASTRDETSAKNSEATSSAASTQEYLATPAAANGRGGVSANQHGRVEATNPSTPDPERVRKRKRTMLGEVKALQNKLQAKKALVEKKTLPTSELNPKSAPETASSSKKKPKTRTVEQPLKESCAKSSVENQDTSRAPIAQQSTKRHVTTSKHEAKKPPTQPAKVPKAPVAASAAPTVTSRATRSKSSAKQKECEPEQEEPPVAASVPAMYSTRGSRNRTKETST